MLWTEEKKGWQFETVSSQSEHSNLLNMDRGGGAFTLAWLSDERGSTQILSFSFSHSDIVSAVYPQNPQDGNTHLAKIVSFTCNAMAEIEMLSCG